MDPLVLRGPDSRGDLRLADGAFCLVDCLSGVFDFRNILRGRRIILRPAARRRDDNSRHRSARSQYAVFLSLSFAALMSPARGRIADGTPTYTPPRAGNRRVRLPARAHTPLHFPSHAARAG
jgi:hypothetical protein